MIKNIGKTDKIVRVSIAVILVIAGILAGGKLGIALGILALVLILTSVIGFCGLYKVFGINTCKVEGLEKKS